MLSIFADRMPTQIGDFISRVVYNDKLKSIHKVTSLNCLAFVDANLGKEESEGKSWKVSK